MASSKDSGVAYLKERRCRELAIQRHPTVILKTRQKRTPIVSMVRASGYC
jgi:hypothetical protein